jgi:hypothetical protein
MGQNSLAVKTASKRGKAQAKSWYPEPALVRKRVAEMTRAYMSFFPQRQLPNNSLGRKWARYMIRTKRLYPGPHDYLWLKSWCPWMNESDQDEILGLKGHWYTTGSLGARLEIGNAMRQDLALWTMRPDDVEWEQFQLEQNKREYLKVQEKRRAKGVKPRRKGTAEPWKAHGMSKATYYRKKLHLAHETPESTLTSPVGRADSQVSLSQAKAAAITPAAPSKPKCSVDVLGTNVIDLRRTPLPTLPKGWPYCAHHIVCTDRGSSDYHYAQEEREAA